MSERQEVEVLVPVDRPPTRAEHAALRRIAFDAAERLVAPTGGRVLGMVSIARAETVEGALAMRARFAVLAPERK